MEDEIDEHTIDSIHAVHVIHNLVLFPMVKDVVATTMKGLPSLDPKMFLFAKKENPSTYDHKDWDIDKTVFAENLINLLN